MNQSARWLAILGLIALAVLPGCQRPPAADEPVAPAPAPEPAAEPPVEEPPAEDATEPETPAEDGGEPAGEVEPAAGAESSAEAPPPMAAPALEGRVLTPKDGVEILLPDGWEEQQADDGALVRMARSEPVAGVLVNLTLDYNVDESLPAGTTALQVKDDFLADLQKQMADVQWATDTAEPVTVAGRPALAVTGDLTDQGTPYRARMLVIVSGNAYWTLTVLGPRDAFATKVAPEFDAVAASLKLP